MSKRESFSPLRVAVIGLGNMGKHHVRHWKSLPGASLVAVCDSHQERADQFSKEYNCKAYTSLETLLESESLDAVSLTAPTFLHFELAKALITRGISVLIEKPISETVEQANILIQLAKEHGVTLMVGHIERFNPAVVALKEFIDGGHLGTIVSVISRRANVFPSQMKDANVAIDLAVHDIDIVNYLLGQTPIDCTSHFGNALIQSRPDHLDLFLRYPSASGFIQVNWITPTPIRKLHVTGTKGYIDLDYKDKTATFYPSVFEKTSESVANDTVRFLQAEPVPLSVSSNDALRDELLHFLSCVISKTQPVTDGAAGLLALQWALNALTTKY